MLRQCLVVALLVLPLEALAGPAGPEAEAPPPPEPGPVSVSAPQGARPAKRAVRRRSSAVRGRRRLAKAARRRTVERRARRTAAYRRALARWRQPPARALLRWEGGFRDLAFYNVNLRERATIRLFRADGSIDREAMSALRRVLRDRRTGEAGPIDDRLVGLIYRIADHFRAVQVTVISGFRSARRGRGGLHARGAAVDFLLPGVPDADVVAYAQTLGHCGVGSYPTSGFVHLDVRERSYFWTDRSGPGQRQRRRQVGADRAKRADRRWSPSDDVPRRRDRADGVEVILARGAEPVPDVVGEPAPDVVGEPAPEHDASAD